MDLWDKVRQRLAWGWPSCPYCKGRLTYEAAYSEQGSFDLSCKDKKCPVRTVKVYLNESLLMPSGGSA